MEIAHKSFLKYCRTLMFFGTRLRGLTDLSVHIPSVEIEERFFPFPRYNKKEELQKLRDIGQIRMTRKGRAYFYEVLTPGGIDISMMNIKSVQYDPTTVAMKEHLKSVSLQDVTKSTDYFTLFLKHKENYLDYFFTVDDFSGRIHTPVTSFSGEYRPYILLDGEETKSIDVVTMQPLLLGKVLSAEIGDNEYSSWINNGEDVYVKLQDKAGLETRDAGKKKFFEILFGKADSALAETFGNSNWIDWINAYKQAHEPRNPHGLEKRHSNLAWKLQTFEVKIMRKIWEQVVKRDICFLSVHDEIIVQKSKINATEEIMCSVLGNHFDFYKLKTKLSNEDQVTEPILPLPEPETAIPTGPFNAQTDSGAVPTDKARPHLAIALKKATNYGEDWTRHIKELETFFNSVELPTGPVKLDTATTITNVPGFIDSNLQAVKHNNGNIIFYPYLERLCLIKAWIESQPANCEV